MAGKKREWLRKKLMMPKSELGLGFRIGAFSAAWRQWRWRSRSAHSYLFARSVVLLYQNAAFYVLWVVEAVVVVSSLCFFFLRFGFSL